MKILRITPLALALALVVPAANASIITLGDGADGQYDCDIAIGDNAISAGGHAGSDYACSIAIGTNTTAGSNSTVIGNGASAHSGSNGTAIGAGSEAGNWYATTVGTDSHATGQAASAFGQGSIAGGQNASAFGAFSSATFDNSVALGANTASTRANEVAIGNRQLTQVADATEDTDAVNLRQLNAAIAGITPGTGSDNPYFKANGANDGGDNAFATGPRSVAAGPDASAVFESDAAFGNGARADSSFTSTAPECQVSDGVAGGGALAMGKSASAEGCGAVAQGNAAGARGVMAYAGGSAAQATADYATAVGPGSNASARFATATGPSAQAWGEYSAAYGNNAQAQQEGAAAFGSASWAGYRSTALGNGAGAPNAMAVALGSGTQTTRDNEVAVGNRVIGQLLDGVRNDDAATVRQLGQVADFFGGGASLTNGVWTNPTFAFPDGATFNNVNNALLHLYSLGGTGSGQPGPQGPAGANGLSAYEVAVQNGFEGSETEWIESLHGADGRDGVDGANGGTNKVNGGRNIEVADNDDGTQTVSVADNIQLSENGSVEVGATRVDAQGVHIEGGPSMTTQGIDAGNRRITGVAAGRVAPDSFDAINGSQLYDLEQKWNDRWTSIDNRIDQLDRGLDRVCAMGAAQARAAAIGAGINTRNSITYAVGGCGGQSALAAQYLRSFETKAGNPAAFSAGVSASSGNKVSFSIGWGFGW